MKRILSLILVVLMVSSLFPASILTVDAASYTSPAGISEDEVIKKINNLTSLLDKKYFTTTQKSCGNNSCNYCYNVNVFNSSWFKSMFGNVSVNQIPGHAYPNGSSGTPAGWTCHGFVNFAMWYIFSSSQTDKVSYNRIVDNVTLTKSNVQKYVKPGDIIRYGEHSVVFISANDSNFTVLDCNAQLSGDGYARVRKHTISYKSNYIMAVSRAKNYVDSMLTIQYNANGGMIPAHCSYEVTTPDTVLRLRSEPSLSATNLTQLPDGTIFDATETKTAEGYTWAKTTYNGYTGWCAVSDGLATRLGYYLQSDDIYRHSDMKLRTQKWKYGEGGKDGLINDTTFAIQKEGYAFVGWSLSKDGSTTVFDQNNTSLKAEDICPDVKNGSQTVTLYAVWKADTFTVSYDTNGGSGAPGSQTKTYGQPLTLSSTVPTRTGYTFLGWSTSSSATTATYTAGGSFTIDAATTLYAVWKVNTYTVSYNANGGSGAPGSQTKTYGQPLTLSSTVPTRTGYTFLGWSTSSSATTATYTAGGSYTTDTATILYAVWDQIHLGTVDKWNVTLEDDLKVNFYVRVSDSLVSTARIKLTVATDTYTYSPKDLTQNENGCYLISIKMAAAQMNDSIIITGMNGGQTGSVSSYTVRQYCDTILADSAHSRYHALVKEMLNYSAMAQVYFDYNADNLANYGITGTAAIAVPSSAQELTLTDNLSSLDFYGASLVYRDRIAVRYYFTGDITGLIFTANGNIYTPVAKDGMYYIEIADILPQNLEQQITLTVVSTQGSTLSVTYGPMNYIVRMNQKGDENTQNLLKALYNYHLAAKALA